MIEVRVEHVAPGTTRAERSAAAWTLVGRLLRDVAPDVVPGPPSSPAVTRRCARCGSTSHGKPEVPVALAAGWHVSVSTTDGRVAAALSDDGPVGVDVESISAAARPETVAVALHPAERRTLGSLADAAAARRLAATWARKEAALKATGDGLALDPATILLTAPDDARGGPGGPGLSGEPDGSPGVLVWPGPHGAEVARRLHLRDVDAGDGYVACVAVLRD